MEILVKNEICSKSHDCESCPERTKLLEINGDNNNADNGCPLSKFITRETETSTLESYLDNKGKRSSLIWNTQGTFVIKCSCQPLEYCKDEIISRKILFPFAKAEPCNSRCSELRSRKICSGIEEPRKKAKQYEQTKFYVGWAISSK